MAIPLEDRAFLEYRVETARLTPVVLTELLRTYLSLPNAVAATEAIVRDRRFIVVLFEPEDVPAPQMEWTVVYLPTVMIENFVAFGYETPASISEATPQIEPVKEIIAT